MFGSFTLKSRFLNSLIWRGRKMTAENTYHNILFELKRSTLFYNFDVFRYSMLNLRPLISLQSIKIGSVIFKVPVPASERRKNLMSVKFLINSAKVSGTLDSKKLVSSLIAVYSSNKNPASDSKFALYKEGLNNRVFMNKLYSLDF